MYIVYKTTNTIDNKFYYGVHRLNTRKSYLGSGTYFKRAVRIHGYKNFKRETLFTFKTAEEAYQKEAEIVTLTEVIDPNCYNLKLGGKGGKSGIITVKDATTGEVIGVVTCNHPNIISGKWVHILKGRDTFKHAREKISQIRGITKSWSRKGYKSSDATKERIRNARLGTKASEDTKQKMRLSADRSSRPELICPHCNKTGRSSAMYRWHFDRCSR